MIVSDTMATVEDTVDPNQHCSATVGANSALQEEKPFPISEMGVAVPAVDSINEALRLSKRGRARASMVNGAGRKDTPSTLKSSL